MESESSSSIPTEKFLDASDEFFYDCFSSPNENLPRRNSTDWAFIGLLIKSIQFQISLIITLIKLPPKLISTSLTIISNPYRTVRSCRRYLLSNLIELLNLKHHKQTRRLAWGLCWAVYVSIVLFSLLALAFMISGFLITHLAHKPLVIKESLNFDYTKNSPKAYVHTFTGLQFSSEIVVSMVLPESEYNRNLGMFQIRVDFVSSSDRVIASLSKPCMVRFRSETIRFVQTLLKIFPLVTGYVSEVQSLDLKFVVVGKDLSDSVCLKVVIEQRAEFRDGAGVPEIYDASLLVKSELPLFRRFVWNWKWTLFVWIGMSLFVVELVFVLVLFTFVIISRDRTASVTR